MIGAHELKNAIYELRWLAGGNGIVQGKAAVARDFGGGKDSPVGPYCDPMTGAPGGSGNGKSRRAVTV